MKPTGGEKTCGENNATTEKITVYKTEYLLCPCLFIKLENTFSEGGTIIWQSLYFY